MQAQQGGRSGSPSEQGFEHMLMSITPRDMGAFSAMMMHTDADTPAISHDAMHLTANLKSLAAANTRMWSSAESAHDHRNNHQQSISMSACQSTRYHLQPRSSLSHLSTQHSASANSEEPTQFICWDHGCQGRVFINYSNLRRHCREQSETAEKTICEGCGRQFSRHAAKERHRDRGRCKKSSASTSNMHLCF
jgi:hypothetical protein